MTPAILMKVVAGVDAMNSDYHYKNIQAIQKVIEQEVLGNSYSLDQLLDINDKMTLLINSLGFWLAHENMDRYTYDLQSFLAWVQEKN
jgi:hypothetical protein